MWMLHLDPPHYTHSIVISVTSIMELHIRDAIWDGLIKGLKIDPNNTDEQFCEACAAGKPTKQAFLKESLAHPSNFREWVHWDLWGPVSVKSHGRKSFSHHKTRHGYLIVEGKWPHMLGLTVEVNLWATSLLSIWKKGVNMQTLLIASGLPCYLWAEAMAHGVETESCEMYSN